MPLPDHQLIICGIPELTQHSMAGVSHVLSIIDTHEPRPPALDAYSTIDHELIRFDDVVAEYPGFEACTPAPTATCWCIAMPASRARPRPRRS